MVYVDLAAAVIVAFSLRLLWVLRRSPLLNLAVAVIVLLPLAPTLPSPATHITTPAVFASGVRSPIAPGATLLFEPFPSNDYSHAMAWQVGSHFAFRLIGGYIIGPYAPGVEALQGLIHSIAASYDISYSQPIVHYTPEDISVIQTSLVGLGVDDVVVGSDASPGTQLLFDAVFGMQGTTSGDFLIWPVAPLRS
jgi:hypothetical protein